MSDFNSIDSSIGIVRYLQDARRFSNIHQVSKYTSLKSLKGILDQQMIVLNNPQRMNDLLEYESYNKQVNWKAIFYSCFTVQSAESMAMWSMYAQPWDEGVRLSLPLKVLKEWIRNIQIVHPVKAGRIEYHHALNNTSFLLSFYRVAYDSNGILSCTGRGDRNSHFPRVYSIPELAGYVKDSAWDYEREARLRVDLNSSLSAEGVAIHIPEEVLENLIITTGPRYSSNQVLMELPKALRGKIGINESKFSNRLGWIPCDDCVFKKPSLNCKSDDRIGEKE